MFDAIALGKRIKEYRNRKNLSQKELGNLCNMSQSTIANIEKGNISTFNIAKLNIIVDALDITLDDILCDSIYALKNNSSPLPYEIKLKQLLLSLDETEIEFPTRFINNYIILKQSTQINNKS